MLEAFEDKQNHVRQANVIIMKVESDDKDRLGGGDDGRGDNGYIVGGYASHGWSAKFPTSGDESSFLFNLTQNLRFNAVKGQRHYQVTDASD
jgi:TLD